MSARLARADHLARGCADRIGRPLSRGTALLLAVLLGLVACRATPLLPAPEGGAMAVASDTALTLRRRADGFYLRLAHRRFNTFETYNDRIMREHFRSPALFLDYYADLAQAFADAQARGVP